MALAARYAHTNLIAQNATALVGFYERVFGCTPLPPGRDLSGEALDRATGVKEAHLRGMHLRLPGHGPTGPTLEIFEYLPQLSPLGREVHRPGFGHIAFAVNDVQEARRAVLEAGGGEIGEVVTLEVAGVGSVTFAYLTDPEGNILEVQQWI